MDLDDYGIIDTLTPAMLSAIDQGLIAEVTFSGAHTVARLMGDFMQSSPVAVPGMPDYFYLMRIEHMIDAGALVVCREAEYLMQSDVRLPNFN